MADDVGAPARLRSLASWQAGRVATIGARLTATRMPLEARSDFAVLAALTEFGALTQADLGRRLGLDRANVNGIVARLEEAKVQAERAFDAEQAADLAARFEAGDDFTLEDFLTQMQGLRKMGSMKKMLGMLPGMAGMREQL